MCENELIAFLAGCLTTLLLGLTVNEAFAYGPDLGRALLRRAARWKRPEIRDEFLQQHIDRIEKLKEDGKLWSGAGLGLTQLALSPLLRPNEEFFVANESEEVLYRERQHWAAVLQPSLELLVLLFIYATYISGFEAASMLSFAGAALAFVYGLLTIRSHWWPPLTKELATWAVMLVVLVLVAVFGGWSSILALLVAVGLIRHLVIVVRWWYYEHRWITTRQVVETGGLFGVIFAYLPLGRVEEVAFTRTRLGRIFGYSTASIKVASEHHPLAVMRFIADPERFQAVLEDQVASAPAHDGGDEGAIVKVGPNEGVRFL
ncbi:MAG: PH domain-containing protein [Acidimicrobiales bacterium]